MSDFDEKAKEIVHDMLDSDIEDCHCEGVKIMTMQMVNRISSALKEAVEEENEVCAGIADDHGGLSGCEIADAIRSRKETPDV